jgi:hypothetical protein
VQQIRHELGRDRDARLILAVLARVSKKRNDSRDPIRARASRRVHHDQQLHQVLIRGRRSRLNNEHVVSANVLLNPDVSFAIRKRADRRLS